MEGFIYLWTNKLNGKKYVGSHVGLPTDSYIGSGCLFRRAIKKYGIENFSREILEEVEKKDDVKKREQHYLDLLKASSDPSFYNLSPHADGGWDYVNNDPILNSRRKEHHSGKWKRHKHPRGMKGKEHSGEIRHQISQTMKTRSKTRTYQPSRAIEQWNGDELVQVFDSINDAAKMMNGSASNIKYAAEGKFKKMYGYIWRYRS